jgi:hypothetical protein
MPKDRVLCFRDVPRPVFGPAADANDGRDGIDGSGTAWVGDTEVEEAAALPPLLFP